MLVIDNGDAIRGIAEVVEKLDFIVNGYVGTTATQLADGQLADSEGDLYASGADATVVTSITIVNTDSAARTFTLYLKPSAGTARAISPVSLDLGIGHSFYTDGQRAATMDASGRILATWTVHDTPVDGATAIPISSNYMYDHVNAADPHTGYMLESVIDAEGDIIYGSGDNAITRLAKGDDDQVLTLASGVPSWAAAAGGATIVTGTYSGNDSDDRQITTGFKCSCVILMSETSSISLWVAMPDGTLRQDGDSNLIVVDLLLHATDGFVVDENAANASSLDPYNYWAISE